MVYRPKQLTVNDSPLLTSARGAVSDTASQQAALSQVIAHIRASLDLETIFQTTATEVRQLLKADRVGVFRFFPDQRWAGELVAEDVVAGVMPALGRRIEDPCFGDRFAVLYKTGHINAVSDFQSDDFYPCHVDLMASLQVRANIVAPLLKGQDLWGLLCIHQCHQPRHWKPADIEFVRQIAEHLSVALHHADLLAQARTQADQQRTLTAVISRIRTSLDLDTTFQTTAMELRQLLQADRVGIFQFSPDELGMGEWVAEDVTQGVASALGKPIEEQCFHERYGERYRAGHVTAVADCEAGDYPPCYLALMRSLQVRANLVVPLLKGDALWGLLCIHQCSAPRTWQASEIGFVRQIGEQLSIALQQDDYIQQVQQHSAQLTEALEQQRSAEHHKALTETVDKIRQTLEVTTIFQTATDEVNTLFGSHRTVIYRFNPDWSGDFVAETVAANWISLMASQIQLTDTCLETQGYRYQHSLAPCAVSDIYDAGYAGCHIEMLEAMQARAFLIAPIFQKEALWGLLATYQNDGPRQWRTDESYMLAQIAAQLGVALQQAEYLNCLEQQSAQLTKASERQRSLANTIDKIRRSLDIQTIFQTTTQEVRQLLGVERVAIYRFHSDWTGEFVADSSVDGCQPFPPSIDSPTVNLTSPIMKPGQHPRHEVFVPILQGEELWGLLMAYQGIQRIWPEEDINLLAQIGAQLGVALQQAELLEKTQSQKMELTRALKKIRQSQAHLIQSEKMVGLGQLVAGVAHEINNPINFIAGNLNHVQRYAEDLLNLLQQYQAASPHPSPAIADYIEEIDLDFLMDDLPRTLASMTLGTKRIRQIVLSLRNFSRLDQAEMKAVDIHEGIDSTILILQHRFKGRDDGPAIELVKQYGDLPLIECYPAQLNQVFMNILSNAIDALQPQASDFVNPRTPCIQIRTETVGQNWVRIYIVDNGPGIPEAIKSKLFDPFFTTKEPGKGTGLGLSISYQIVTEKHHGHLKCLSTPTQGTTFILEVPTHPNVDSLA
ncbi:MAG: GAF domain-containing protein [Leptolyngbya sp. SIO1E4]|nr:GAF domain-containing protein [Leptolyngbya sp. SIO1E4]